MDELEQSLIEEGKINPIRKETIIALTPGFKTSLLNYLETKPHREVDVLVQALKGLNPIEITING